MWIRKPTPVTTDSMVSDSPSSVRLTLMSKLPTCIQVQSAWLKGCWPLAKKSMPT